MCAIAKDYVDKGKSKEAFIHTLKMPQIKELLTEAAIVEGWTNRKKSAAEKILSLVQDKCACC